MINNEYMPDEVSSPGESLADVLEERGMLHAELARKMGTSAQIIHAILNGNAPITQEIATKLEMVLEIPARFWMNRQEQYQASMTRKQKTHS
jgi:addiction module HigA family antidote